MPVTDNYQDVQDLFSQSDINSQLDEFVSMGGKMGDNDDDTNTHANASTGLSSPPGAAPAPGAATVAASGTAADTAAAVVDLNEEEEEEEEEIDVEEIDTGDKTLMYKEAKKCCRISVYSDNRQSSRRK